MVDRAMGLPEGSPFESGLVHYFLSLFFPNCAGLGKRGSDWICVCLIVGKRRRVV